MTKLSGPRPPLCAFACALLLSIAGPALAHEGEDHGAPPPVLSQATLPRAVTASDDFELVAIVEAGRLLVYLDAKATNEPVPTAKVEVEGAGLNAAAPELEPGVYALGLAQPLAAGRHALTFTVQTDKTADLLSAILDMPAPASVAAPAGAAADSPAVLRALWPWLGGAAALAIGGLALASWRRRRTATPI